MKCNKCFYCTKIGKGIYADCPVKYCKHLKIYILPYVETKEGTMRKLDLSDTKDIHLWEMTGCRIHPATVEKAKREFLKKLETEES